MAKNSGGKPANPASPAALDTMKDLLKQVPRELPGWQYIKGPLTRNPKAKE